ncbi:hypothetical protein [Mycolicibacter sinensis]|uniref:hypothetical protein n=1 Tax=Mycolicibacter sinensis (strain JDM601) TaxID=875328 RepID=UPI0013016404|nr:hypothetical protein [Mycolicibacter sinensis]
MLAVATLVLGVVVVVQAAMLRCQGWGISWGTMPDWISAFGGLATVLALVVAWLVYRHEVRSRQEDELTRIEAERREQAENLTSWLAGQTSIEREVIQGEGPVVTHTVQVNILNASPSVFYDVVVVATCRHLAGPALINVPAERRQRFEPKEWVQRRDRVARGRAQVVPPGAWRVSVKLAHQAVIAEQVHLFFRDHRGIYWWRDADGQLSEQPPPVAANGDGKTRIQQIEDSLGEGPSDAGIGVLAPKRLTDSEAT